MEYIDLTHSWIGYLVLAIFVIWYIFIALEDRYNINKAKIALFVGTLLFILIWIYFKINWLDTYLISQYINHLVVEIAEIVFFLFVAMTFIEALIDRNVFEVIKYKLIQKWFTYKKLYWILGILAFFLSPIADNLTTALILSTVLVVVWKWNKDFLLPSAINIVVAANAWWVWSPFGDITTLMAWTYGKASFFQFFQLFPAAFVWWLVTAFLLYLFVPDWKPSLEKLKVNVSLKRGAWWVVIIGIFTLATAVSLEQFLHIPPMWWMMFGLSILKLYSYYLKISQKCKLNIFNEMRKVEYDTLMFFFGILSAVGALHFLWYLAYVTKLYEFIWSFWANIGVWVISAIIDNVPVMAAILKSDLSMSVDERLLLTLTIWIGGSLISFGSAAWIAVMGKVKGVYTFTSHLKYVWTIALGFIVSIIVWYIQFMVL